MRRTLQIELRSDLCAGTGKHYAALIDLDTALDEYGIPFIPARRIKGCMREIADQLLGLDADTLKALFGEPGTREPGGLWITDARIRNYDGQLEEIRSAIEANLIHPNDITELFCSVRAETAIENDTAKDGSLRFFRVVNRISPLTNGEPLTFCAELEFDDAYLEIVKKLCKGLKNLGYKRNRGFGLVHCTLSDEDTSFRLKDVSLEDDGEYRLDLLVYLNEDLTLPSSDANHTLDYIPGSSLLGAFAAQYIKEYGEECFSDVFLSEKVRFGNLYISDKNGGVFHPAPRFLARVKSPGVQPDGIQNMIANRSQDEKKSTPPQYKPLKRGYFSKTLGYKEAQTEIVYHNALNTKESAENNGGLYTQQCVSSGQYFKGYILADGKTMKKLYPLLKDGAVSFGRSKTAQYARCFVISADVSAEAGKASVHVNAGKTAAFLCESDIVLMKGGGYTVALADLCGALFDKAGIPAPSVSINRFTNISCKVVSGYNVKWNHKKPQFPVIRAGSTVVIEAVQDIDTPLEFTIGERRNEGYGRILFLPDASACQCHDQGDAHTEPLTFDVVSSDLLKAAKKQKDQEELIAIAIADADGLEKRLNASQVGRLTLMCRESRSIEDFASRVNSIKTDSFRKCASERLLINMRRYADWRSAQKYAILVLSVTKYSLKAGKEER